jgi:hypothetical protein
MKDRIPGLYGLPVIAIVQKVDKEEVVQREIVVLEIRRIDISHLEFPKSLFDDGNVVQRKADGQLKNRGGRRLI